MNLIDSTIATTLVEPRKYQRNITQKVVDMFCGRFKERDGSSHKYKSIMVESPTGSGKTVMAHMIAKCLQQEHPDMVVGWMAMRRNLLTQASVENTELGFNVNNIQYISMFDKEPEYLINARKNGKKILMVVDECQHDSSASSAHLHNIIEPDMILGLTATPFRTDRVKLCFDRVVKDSGIHQLIQDGFLSRYKHYTIDSWTPEVVAEHYCSEPDRWGRSVVFFHKWEDCQEFYNIVQSRSDEVIEKLRINRPDLKINRSLVETVRGGGSRSAYDERDKLLDDFRDGDVAVLVNCMVLTEGFDAPALETAFVRDSCKGPTMQMAGRAFRIHPEWKTNKNERFRYKNIVQSKNSNWSILKTAMASYQYVWQEDSWRSLTINPNIQAINSRTRIAIANTDVFMPKFIADRQKKKSRIGRFN